MSIQTAATHPTNIRRGRYKWPGDVPIAGTPNKLEIQAICPLLKVIGSRKIRHPYSLIRISHGESLSFVVP